MSLVVGTNSWSTVAEADTYLANRPTATDWFALDTAPGNPGEASKESYLDYAFYLILGSDEFSISKDSTDDNVKEAQIEEVLFLLRNQLEFENRDAMIASGIEDFKVSKWSESLGDAVGFPSVVNGKLGNYSIVGGAVVLLEGEDYE